MMALPYVTAVGTGRTIRTTGIAAETGKTSGTTAIWAEIRSIGEIWTITPVSLIQMDSIQVVDFTILVVDGLYSTTVLQVGKGVGMIRVMKNVCPGEPKIIISGLVGPELMRMISKKEHAWKTSIYHVSWGTATDRA